MKELNIKRQDKQYKEARLGSSSTFLTDKPRLFGWLKKNFAPSKIFDANISKVIRYSVDLFQRNHLIMRAGLASRRRTQHSLGKGPILSQLNSEKP